MTDDEHDKLIRDYAAGEITWAALQRRGIDNYVDVLAGLGKLGLRPPVAPLDGTMAEVRMRGRAVIREALKIKP